MTEEGGVEARVEDGRIVLEARGLYPLDHYLQRFAEALDAPSDRPFLVLCDSRASDVVRSPAEMRRVADFVVRNTPRIRAVAVVTRDGAPFGLTRIAAAVAEHHGAEIGAFRAMEAAEEWLDARVRPR
ncbi:MAG: hypothetical protein RJQ04_05580 [Longimicrobiales bacterium]